MPKGYWVTTYRSIKDPDKLEAYVKLAPVALVAFVATLAARRGTDSRQLQAQCEGQPVRQVHDQARQEHRARSARAGKDHAQGL